MLKNNQMDFSKNLGGGVIVVVDYEIVVSEFELQSRY